MPPSLNPALEELTRTAPLRPGSSAAPFRALARIEKSILAKRVGERGRIKVLDSRVETLAEATLPALRTLSP